MKTENALFIQMDPEFGQFFPTRNSNQSIEDQAAEYYERFMSGNIRHKNYRVSIVERPVRTPINSKIFEKHYAKCHFMTGNVSSNVQESFFVRPHLATECNGHKFEIGALRAADLRGVSERARNLQGASVALKWFERTAEEVKNGVAAKLDDVTTILYLVKHYGADKTLIVHGWMLTDQRGDLLQKLVLDNSPNSWEIMTQAEAVFTHKRRNERLIFEVKDDEVVFTDHDILPPVIARERMR